MDTESKNIVCIKRYFSMNIDAPVTFENPKLTLVDATSRVNHGLKTKQSKQFLNIPE